MSHAEVVQIRNPMKVPVLVFNKPLVERGLDANSEASAAALRTAQEHRHLDVVQILDLRAALVAPSWLKLFASERRRGERERESIPHVWRGVAEVSEVGVAEA